MAGGQQSAVPSPGPSDARALPPSRPLTFERLHPHTFTPEVSKAGNVPNLMVPLVVAGFVLLGLALSVAVDPIYGWGVLAVGLFASMSIGRPRVLLILYLLWSAIAEFALTLTPSPAIRYADEMMVLVVMGVLVMEYINRRPNYPDLRRFLRMAAFLVLIILVSAGVNLVPASRVFHFFLSYLSFIPVFCLAYYALRPRDYRLILRALVVIFFVQFGLNLAWWTGAIPLPASVPRFHEFAVGTLGACNLVAYLSVVVIMGTIAAWRVYHGPIRRTALAILMICGFVQLAVTFTVHAYLVLLGAAFVYYLLIFRDLRNRWVPLVLGILIVSILILVQTGTGPSDMLEQSELHLLSWENISNRAYGMLDGPKGQTALYVLFTTPKSYPLVPLIGGGPGNFLSSIGIINVVPMARDAMGDYFLTYSGRREMVGASILQHPVTGYVSIYSEVGLIGFMLYIGLYVYAMVRVSRHLIRRRYTHPDQYLLAQIHVVGSCTFLSVNLLAELFYFDLYVVTLWLLAACVWTPYRPEEPVADMVDQSEPEDEQGTPRARSLLSRLYGPVSSVSPERPDLPDRGGDGTD